ncbi:rod shape-determining protein MreC [Candidatus Uhrbacteria bacterium]|nr:rod shape-determining protein MreC [Candidatus Uhrbacteria bacterium]
MKRIRLGRWNGGIVLVPILFFLVLTSFFEKPRAFFKSAFDRNISAIYFTYRDSFRALWKSQEAEDISILREQRNSFARIAGDKNILEEENTHLKKMLKFKERSHGELLGARIIGRSTDLGKSMLVIDRGARDGIQKNYPVIAQEGVLIGKIADTRYETSFVRLLHDPKSKTIVSYHTKDQTVQGLIAGKFHTGIELTLIPITEPVEKSALLSTTGTEEYIPAGLLVGFISEYTSTPTDLFYTIQVMPALPLSELSLLSVIVPPHENRD